MYLDIFYMYVNILKVKYNLYESESLQYMGMCTSMKTVALHADIQYVSVLCKL